MSPGTSFPSFSGVNFPPSVETFASEAVMFAGIWYVIIKKCRKRIESVWESYGYIYTDDTPIFAN